MTRTAAPGRARRATLAAAWQLVRDIAQMLPPMAAEWDRGYERGDEDNWQDVNYDNDGYASRVALNGIIGRARRLVEPSPTLPLPPCCLGCGHAKPGHWDDCPTLSDTKHRDLDTDL